MLTEQVISFIFTFLNQLQLEPLGRLTDASEQIPL